MYLQVTVVCSPAPREVFEEVVRVPEGSSIEEDAVLATGLCAAFPQFDWKATTPFRDLGADKRNGPRSSRTSIEWICAVR